VKYAVIYVQRGEARREEYQEHRQAHDRGTSLRSGVAQADVVVTFDNGETLRYNPWQTTFIDAKAMVEMIEEDK
jgi:hypothetical protein